MVIQCKEFNPRYTDTYEEVRVEPEGRMECTVRGKGVRHEPIETQGEITATRKHKGAGRRGPTKEASTLWPRIPVGVRQV